MPLRYTPEEAQGHWVNNIQTRTQAYVQGVQRVAKAPGAAAAANKQGYLDGVTRKADTWASRTAGVSLADWQAATVETGGARWAPGAQAKQGKYGAAMAQVFPYMQQVLGKIDAMPRDSVQSRIARSQAYLQAMSQFKRR